MRVLLLHAHPEPESYGAALARAARGALERAGHAVDWCDLYAEGFEPVLSRAERGVYHDVPDNASGGAARASGVAGHVERLRAADGLVIAAPVWNFGPPAILKGYYDRVFLPGVSFELHDGRVRGALRNIGRAATITTYGAHRWRAMLAGDPPRAFGTRVLRAMCGARAKVSFHALYDMNRATDADRTAFLARIEAAMARF